MTTPGLYVHIPFCRSRCTYCTFVSSIYDSAVAEQYISALGKELDARASCLQGTPSTLFIGGGTPSCLAPHLLHNLLSRFPMPNGEATCELNPDSVEIDTLRLLHDAGINRFSFGVQTFVPGGLRLLGRRHTAEEAKKKIRLCSVLNNIDINIDLISAWPGQTIDQLCIDIDQAVDLGAVHISCYNLMIEQQSRLAAIMRQTGLYEYDDETQRRFWDAAEERLAQHGFVHYEVSNFARPGHECQHNVHTWKGGAYLGVGLAAHSHIGGRRWANTDNMTEYLASPGHPPEAFSEHLVGADKARECAVFWLRMKQGINLTEFAEVTGIDFFALYGKTAKRLITNGFLECEADMVRVHPAYYPMLDSVLEELV